MKEDSFEIGEAFIHSLFVMALATAVFADDVSVDYDHAKNFKQIKTYTWKHADIEILIIDGQLTMIALDAKNAWESRLKLTPIGPDTSR